MEVINTVVGKMVEVLTERFLTSMGRRIGYVVHYKKNIEDLETKVQNLRGVRGRIKGKVDTARNNGHVIETDVLDWLMDVNKKEEDLNRLLVDRENIKSCFDVRSRYRIGKEGKKLSSDVSGLIDHGSNFDTVGHRAPLDKIWYTPTKNFEQFESREYVHKHIIKALENEMIYKIGIYGMAGSGKTRTAEEIAKQTQEEKLFDEVTKAVFSQIPDLKKIQKELAECLNMSFETETEVGRKGELCNRLKNGKKILVIIDDVWSDEVKLEEIGIPSHDNHNKGCKVLLTSRREDVCSKMGVQENFPIGLLQEYEAWDLFKKTVGDFIESPHEIHSVAKQVCRECNCLPLAILVVGATLSNQKEKHVWDDALVQLSSCRGYNIEGVTEKLYSRIEWSYNYLRQPDFRSCFLYCSLFPEDAEIPIDDLVMYGVATKFLKDNSYTMKTARDRTLVLVDTLKKSHLLLEGKRRDFVKMHDVIRDVAISIASKEGFLAKTGVPQWPEKDEYESHKVISLRSKNICELPCELECSELRTLVLECDTNHRPQAPDSFFKRTEKVEVLDLCHVQLPSSLLNLINLRMLRLWNCGQVNLAFLKELRKLEILSIADSDLKEVVVEIGQLTSLRWLDWRNCTKLEIIPSGVIKRLSNIEELYIPYNFRGCGDEGNVGLDELNSLTRLTNLQIHIGNGMLLPNELCFKLLNRFKISIGRTSGFQDGEVNLGVKMLKLHDITLRKEFNILMEKADILILKRMEGLKNVLHYRDGKGFLELKYLKIEDCSDMEHLLGRPKWNLQTQGSFSKLNVLIVKNCTLKFLFFPSMARALLQLQELDILKCQMMEEIILDNEEVIDRIIFCQLKKMKLHYLPILRSICGNKKKTSTTECSTSTDAQALFNEKVSFPALEELVIRELNSVSTIWDNQLLVNPETEEESFRRLRHLMIYDCKKLENVIPSNLIPRLQNLETLGVWNCDVLVSAVEVLTMEKGFATTAPTIELPRLQKMRLDLLPKLMLIGLNRKEHSDHRLIGAYSNLTYLFIDRCHSLRNVFSSSIVRNLRQLQYLMVTDCEKIEEIIAVESGRREEEVAEGDEIIVFPQLKNIELRSLPGLKSFWFGSKKAAVESQVQVQAIFNEKVSTFFSQLTLLNIDRCHSLRNVFSPSMARNLQQLQKLRVSDCEKIEEIIAVEMVQGEEEVTRDEIIVFPQLKNMEFIKVKFPSLEEFFYLGSENNLKEIWNTTVPIDYFCKLRRLHVCCCDELLSVAPSKLLKSFQNLEELEIGYFPSLEEIFKVEGRSNNAEQGIVVARDKDIEEELETISELPSLAKMKIKDCPKLKSVAFYTSKEKVSTSFPWLTSLSIDGCHSLRNVFTLPIAKNLQQLQDLRVKNCEKIEDIITVETVQGEEEVMDDEIIVFPQLKEMELEWLPNLKSFWSGSKKAEVENDISQVQALFNHKVKFLSLENFEYGWNKNNLKEIWSSTVSIDVVCKLRKLRVNYCNKLLSIALPSKLLQNLEELYIKECPNLEKGLETMGVEKVSTSFSRLTLLNINGCHSLRNVFSPSVARNLLQLQNLTIRNCEKIKDIIAVETVQGEEEVKDDEIIVFPQLKNMKFGELPNLKSFWSGYEKAAVENDIPQVQALFNHKVKFPSLEEFFYTESKNKVKVIWNTTVPIDSFCKLRRLTVDDCDELLSVVPSKLIGSFQNLKEFNVRFCSSLEVVFNNLEGVEDRERGATVSSRITKLELFFLPKLVHIGIMDLQGLLAFHSLRSLTVNSCKSLEYLFLLSMARNLTKIEVLKVEDCDAIEEVIRNEDQGEEDGVMDEIVFPKLKSMELEGLANLTSFCGANNAFKLPSLTKVTLCYCPKMQTFTSGRISTQLIELRDDKYRLHKVSDLNKYVEQCVQKKERM